MHIADLVNSLNVANSAICSFFNKLGNKDTAIYTVWKYSKCGFLFLPDVV